jgi:hypothetical protein
MIKFADLLRVRFVADRSDLCLEFLESDLEPLLMRL